MFGIFIIFKIKQTPNKYLGRQTKTIFKKSTPQKPKFLHPLTTIPIKHHQYHTLIFP